jgi:tRNA pseudouridine55 synthase
MDGLLPVWKPTGISSFDVIRRLKHEVLATLPGKIKIGHAGTLDPFAEGVLIIMFGAATKKFDEIMTWGKTYRAVARLGASSDTLDRTGQIDSRYQILDSSSITIDRINTCAQKFVGEIEQTVPSYSAAKYKGKTLYRYAREGIAVPEKKKRITIHSLTTLNIDFPKVELRVTCSSGTYIRQLSYDLFKTLGEESYLESLIRERVGEITQHDCLTFDQLTDVDMVAQRVRLFLDGSDS